MDFRSRAKTIIRRAHRIQRQRQLNAEKNRNEDFGIFDGMADKGVKGSNAFFEH